MPLDRRELRLGYDGLFLLLRFQGDVVDDRGGEGLLARRFAMVRDRVVDVEGERPGPAYQPVEGGFGLAQLLFGEGSRGGPGVGCGLDRPEFEGRFLGGSLLL